MEPLLLRLRSALSSVDRQTLRTTSSSLVSLASLSGVTKESTTCDIPSTTLPTRSHTRTFTTALDANGARLSQELSPGRGFSSWRFGSRSFSSGEGPTTAAPDKPILYSALPNVSGDEAKLLDSFVASVKEGRIDLGEVVKGLVDGHLTRQDLNLLLHRGAVDEFSYKRIIEEAVGGTPKLSFKEIAHLVKDHLIGKDDIVWMLEEGMIVPGDIDYLVQKEYLPGDLGAEILRECRELPVDDKTGFSDVLAGVQSGEITMEALEALVINGQFSAEDVDLLVGDGLIEKEKADEILQDSAEEISEAFNQATAFAMMVGDGKVTHEELEVMRVKGLLGASVVHFLVNQGVVSHEKGAELLSIEEDPELDLDGIEGVDRGAPDVEALPPPPEEPEEEEEGDESSGEPGMSGGGSGDDNGGGGPGGPGGADISSTTGRGKIGARASPFPEGFDPDVGLDGFYPPHIDKDDIFSLWEHLEKTYKHIPGLPSVQEILQEAANEEKEEKRRKRMAEEAKKDIERVRIVDDKGRAYATGKRKCSVARVWIKEGDGNMVVNSSSVDEYFKNMDTRVHVAAPFVATRTLGQFDLLATVKGGGLSGQAQAVRHGVALALQKFDPEHRPILKSSGLLTRDAREVERKKPGRAKARKSFAWVKR
ncbi:hypothetical protein BSKO_02219 [Bryopsis sp. KO-2023]|nr:hypothetical protein BSKO_02219 [Bryopsis sp. KO-2023]